MAKFLLGRGAPYAIRSAVAKSSKRFESGARQDLRYDTVEVPFNR